MHFSPIDDLRGPIGIVCNDAGGANQVFAMLSATHRLDIQLVLSGPAVAAYQAMDLKFPVVSDLHELLRGCETVLTGTGWSSNLEFEALRMAGTRGKTSIAVLDHWVNYRVRFERNDVKVRPDKVWVVDQWAEIIARREFPSQEIELVADLYSASIIERVANSPTTGNAEILFIFEPARSTWGRRVEGEWQAWEYFVRRVDLVGAPAEAVIRARPHPSDPSRLAGHLPRRVGSHPVIVDQLPLAESLSRALWVVGMNSSILPLALATKRVVFSCLPPWAPPNQLPHQGIRLL